MRPFWAWLLHGKPATAAAMPPPPARREPQLVSEETLARSRINRTRAARTITEFTLPTPPPGVIPEGGATMAMDDAIGGTMSWANGLLGIGMFGEGLGFLGYPYLSELAQQPEYRRISETIARHMTRKWIKIQARGDTDKTARIGQIQDAMKRMGLRDTLRAGVEIDNYFGRSHLFVDLGTGDKPGELRTPIGNGWDAISKAKVKRGSLKAVRVVEPMWSYPSKYNTTDPLKPGWYSPSSWFVMGTEVDTSRLLTLIARKVPDMLKSAYSFGGLSLSQMAKPSVDNWLRTRSSVSDIISSFSVFVLATNMVDAMSTDGTGIFRRVELFNNLRDNAGTMTIDKDTEDFKNVAVPLGTLDALQAQSQEHCASIVGLPLIEYTGLTPSGLNASSEDELHNFYTTIHGAQENVLRAPIHAILGFIMLSEFGEVDEDITFDFEPLWSMDDKELADTQLVQAQTDMVYVDGGVIDVLEVRRRLGADLETPYAGLDVEDIPEPPAPELTPTPDAPGVAEAEGE